MMFKTGSKIVVLGSAVGVPYLFSNGTELRDKIYESFGRPGQVEVAQREPWQTGGGAGSQEAGSTAPNVVAPTSNAPAYQPAAPDLHTRLAATGPARLDPVELHPLADVFRLDVTTSWVLGNWARVSTALSDLQYHGYRVALVTGTGDGDLAGSLTYYFDHQPQLRRIVFQGNTGDARPLVEHLTTQFNFVREASPDPRQFVYSATSGRVVTGQLRIRPATIVRQDDSRNRFEVGLVIERPAD